jgi:hypothetical protein
LTGGVEGDAGHACGWRSCEHEIDVSRSQAEIDLELRRACDLGRAGIEDRRVARGLGAIGARDLGIERCRNDVLARKQAEQTVAALVVGLTCAHAGSRHRHRHVAGHPQLERADGRARDRLAVIVDDSASDDAASRQRDVDLFERLSFANGDRLTTLVRARLSVFQRDESGPAGGERK